MDQKIQWAVNHMPKTDDKNLPIMGLEEIGKARTFHESFPQYSKTPLTKLDHMAEYLGVKEIYLKDESYRFGLNAFKVLGGSFAMARYIASETGKDVSELPYSVLTSDQLRKELIMLYTMRDLLKVARENQLIISRCHTPPLKVFHSVLIDFSSCGMRVLIVS